MPIQNPARVAIEWEPKNGKRKRGRPKITWRSTFKTDLANRSLSFKTAYTIAEQKNKWHEFFLLPNVLLGTGGT